MTKRAVVFSGGGSKGAISLAAFLSSGLNPESIDVMTGVSTGALTASFLSNVKDKKDILNQANTLYNIYSSLKGDSDIFKTIFPGGTLGAIRGLMSDKRAMYDSSPLKKLISANLRADTLSKSPIKWGIEVTSLLTSLNITLSNAWLDELEELSQHQLEEMILASCSVPGFFPHVNYLVDGGVRNQTPFKLACDLLKHQAMFEETFEIHVFLTSPLDLHWTTSGELSSPQGYLGRTLEILANENYKNDISILKTKNEDVFTHHITLHLYEPSVGFGNPLNFNPKHIYEMLQCGNNIIQGSNPIPVWPHVKHYTVD